MLTRHHRFLALALLAVSGLLPAEVRADAITNQPDPFLGTSVNLTAATPFYTSPFGYTQTLTLTNFVEMSSTITGGNDVLAYTADFMVTFYSDATLTTPTGTVDLTGGTFNVTLTGRTSSYQTGTFGYTVNSSLFSGTVGGQTLQTRIDPSQVSSGTVTISAISGTSTYDVNAPSSAIYAQDQVNGGGYSNVPTLTAASVTPNVVPEPSSIVLAGLAIAGLAAMRRRNLI